MIEEINGWWDLGTGGDKPQNQEDFIQGLSCISRKVTDDKPNKRNDIMFIPIPKDTSKGMRFKLKRT